MRKFLKIITEQSNGHWMAWFEDAPQIASGGKFTFEAIDRLLERYGADHFDQRDIIAVEGAIGPITGNTLFRYGITSRYQLLR